MNTFINPDKSQWSEIAMRPLKEAGSLEETVNEVFGQIQSRGDRALISYTLHYDNVRIDSVKVSEESMAACASMVSPQLREAIDLAIRNVETFHRLQSCEIPETEVTEGVTCWRENRPIESVGIYIPGGTAPLFSTVIMLAVPAKLAGCRNIVLCTPPGRNGDPNPAILYTAMKTGATNVFRVGGIQAIGAMTFGTESIPRVDKIFGPGNQYVTAAKQMAVYEGVAIDMPAGPSEVLIIADENARPEFLAADLLSQAEHGDDSQTILLTVSEAILEETLREIGQQIKELPRKQIAEASVKNSRFILFRNLDECMDFSNLYAPEHLIIATKNARQLSRKVISAGSVFLGNYSCESAGDYASGTNHTLPTNGYARNYSGVSLDSFVKKITFQELQPSGIKNIGPAIEIMAAAEQLEAHRNAVTVRLKSIENEKC